MNSEFYLVDKSFHYPNNITPQLLSERIKDLAIDYEFIRQYDTEKIFRNDSIFDEYIFPDITINDFISYSLKVRSLFNKQIITYLSIIIRKSKKTTISFEEVLEVLLEDQSEEVVHGLMCLFKTNGIEEKYLIYNKHNWLDFHRFYLSEFPKNPKYFMQECEKYFPDLHFHPENSNKVHRILNTNSKTIIHHLTELNRNFPACKAKHVSRIDLLKEFNVLSKLNIPASIEGDLSRKKDLTFTFVNNEKKEEDIYCEMHLKLLKDDQERIVQNRIYFHEGKNSIAFGKILIAHIGVHL